MVGSDKMRVTWVTRDDDAPSTVDYGTSSGQYTSKASGSSSTYRFVLYKSGHIHDVVIGPLNPDTVYYYHCSSQFAREFSLKTPPSQLPIKFAVIGDLGQSEWTDTTLQHLAGWSHDMLLLPGDLSYADYLQPLWTAPFSTTLNPQLYVLQRLIPASRPQRLLHGDFRLVI